MTVDKVWLSTRYYADDKFDGISANAERMFSRLLALAGHLENGGRLPSKPWTYVGLPKARAATLELVRRGILIEFDDGTYDFPAWAGWQDSGDKLVDRKKADRERKRRQRARDKLGINPVDNSNGAGETSENRQEKGHGGDHSGAKSGPVPDPQPTLFAETGNGSKPASDQPERANAVASQSRDMSRDVTVPEERRQEDIGGGYVSRELTSARANDAATPPPTDSPITRGSLALVPDPAPDTDPEPADKCPRHRTRIGRVDEPCRGCRDARLAHEAWTTRTTERAAAERAAAITARRTAIANCTRCDEYGWTIDLATGHAADPARKCTHGDQPT